MSRRKRKKGLRRFLVSVDVDLEATTDSSFSPSTFPHLSWCEFRGSRRRKMCSSSSHCS